MTDSPSESVRAHYHLAVGAEAAAARAEALRYEQTVELPPETVSDPFVEKEILPRVEALGPAAGGGFELVLAFPPGVARAEPASLLGVLFGNCSLQDDVTLTALELAEPVCQGLGGPRLGSAGLRQLAGVTEGPLTCTALKPVGLAPDALAELCGIFARAGIHVVKDDNGLADHPFCPFAERVRACQAAVEGAARETGHRTLYAPNVTGSPAAVARQIELAGALGVRAVILEPMLVGLPLLHELARGPRELALLAHPSFAGAPRIAPEVLLGTLFRACGADAVIFPHAGGRFARFDPPTCRRLGDALRGPCGGLRPALPVPGGGMEVERVEELLRFYGPEVMLLVGGSLYRAGSALGERTRRFVSDVRRAAERLAEVAP